MVKWQEFKKSLQEVCRDESGQVVTEYALLVVYIGLTAMVIAKLFPPAIRAYVRKFYAVIALPIP